MAPLGQATRLIDARKAESRQRGAAALHARRAGGADARGGGGGLRGGAGGAAAAPRDGGQRAEKVLEGGVREPLLVASFLWLLSTD